MSLQQPSTSPHLPETSFRWRATIVYRPSPTSVEERSFATIVSTYDFDEFVELGEAIERGPNFYLVEKITIVINNLIEVTEKFRKQSSVCTRRRDLFLRRSTRR